MTLRRKLPGVSCSSTPTARTHLSFVSHLSPLTPIMSIPSVGSKCANPNCEILDFLPIRCPACSSTFCRDHSLMDAHGCPAAGLAKSSASQWVTRGKCEKDGCEKPSLDSAAGEEGEGRIRAACEKC